MLRHILDGRNAYSDDVTTSNFVTIDEGPLPASGSVKAKAMMLRPSQVFGRYSFFWTSLAQPWRTIWSIGVCAEKKVRRVALLAYSVDGQNVSENVVCQTSIPSWYRTPQRPNFTEFWNYFFVQFFFKIAFFFVFTIWSTDIINSL